MITEDAKCSTKPGKWLYHCDSKIVNWTTFVNEYYTCSDCEHRFNYDVRHYKFCPMCGNPKSTTE